MPPGSGYALASLGVLLIVPLDDSPGTRIDHLDASLALPENSTDAEISGAIRQLLAYRAREVPWPDWRTAEYKAHQIARRRFLNRTFGVKRQSDWLSDARNVSIRLIGDGVTFSPMRRDGVRAERFAGRASDPDMLAPLDNDAELAEGLRQALRWSGGQAQPDR